MTDTATPKYSLAQLRSAWGAGRHTGESLVETAPTFGVATDLYVAAQGALELAGLLGLDLPALHAAIGVFQDDDSPVDATAFRTFIQACNQSFSALEHYASGQGYFFLGLAVSEYLRDAQQFARRCLEQIERDAPHAPR